MDLSIMRMLERLLLKVVSNAQVNVSNGRLQLELWCDSVDRWLASLDRSIADELFWGFKF